MRTKFSRRQLAVSLVAAVPALAQNPGPEPPSDPSVKARETLHKNGEILSQFEIPTATQPSFIFKP